MPIKKNFTYSVITELCSKQNTPSRGSVDMAGGKLLIDLEANSFRLHIDRFRETPVNEESPQIMTRGRLAYLCHDHGPGQLFVTSNRTAPQQIFPNKTIESFTIHPNGRDIFVSDEKGVVYEDSEDFFNGDVPLLWGLDGKSIVGYSDNSDELILSSEFDGNLQYQALEPGSKNLRTLFETSTQNAQDLSVVLNANGSRLFIEKEQQVFEIDTIEGGIHHHDLEKEGPWRMNNLALLGVVDNRFLALKNERGPGRFLYDLETQKYLLQDGDSNFESLREMSGDDAPGTRYHRKFAERAV